MSQHVQSCALSSPLKSGTASVDMHCPAAIYKHCDLTGKKMGQALWGSVALSISQVDLYTVLFVCFYININTFLF